jgi:hypothetical protein
MAKRRKHMPIKAGPRKSSPARKKSKRKPKRRSIAVRNQPGTIKVKRQDLEKHIDWLKHRDVAAFLESNEIPGPWFPAYGRVQASDSQIVYFSAVVLVDSIAALIKNGSNWDIRIGDGRPSLWSTWRGGAEFTDYAVYGNTLGIQPLVICRSFEGLRPNFPELIQELALYHNLYPEPSKRRFLFFDDAGNEAEAVRYGDGFLEVRTDLLTSFCAAKQVALAIYVDGWRDSPQSLADLNLSKLEESHVGAHHAYSLYVATKPDGDQEEFQISGSIWGKKYVLPGPRRSEKEKETYPEFIIGTTPSGEPIRHTCDPEKLFDSFGRNCGAAHELTPVFFSAEVLTKYYSDPGKYSVEDGILRCGSWWLLHMDNDHTDYVVVHLYDLGQDLPESERAYWLSFNIPPHGRKLSETAYRRGFLAEFANPQKADLVFKQGYRRFNRSFRDAMGWDFFLPLHKDDLHFMTGLRLLSKDNQAEFDSQLLALTKLLVDSLNETEIAKGLKTLVENDKGITKLQKFFVERGVAGCEPHIRFLRVLQDLRSKSAAHRKGSSYDKLITGLQIADEGQKKALAELFVAATNFIRFLEASLITKKTS